MAPKSNFAKFVPVETYPIVAIIGGAVVGAGYYLVRLSQGSEVVWNRGGDWRPWDQVKQDQNTKFMTVHPKWWEERKATMASARAAQE
ncbi:hypothetical protein CspHIS471_0700410 [Cutaneotrichosporon sp. HIS471]|nr:hypothetical protein CspHIS471_0700410 [Cutaneotrichosporon sp. HIS471]